MSTPTLQRGEGLSEIATYSVEQATERTIYANEGTNLSAFARARVKSRDPHYRRDIATVVDMYEAALTGNRLARYRFSEAMSTADFSILFADVLDRQVLGLYNHMPVNWANIARRGKVNDFRAKKLFYLDGAEAILDPVDELAEYPAAALTDGKYQYQVTKRGRRLPWSWETQVNDDLDAFADNPQRLANAARFSEEKFATSLYAGASGPDATFFAAGHSNIVTSNPALTIAALQTGFKVLAAMRDADGNPIFVDAVWLVVPPALEVAALNILNATEIRVGTGSGSATTDQLVAANWMKNKVRLMVNPWLPVVSSTANGDTSWYLFADPGAGRPAMEVGFLRGHEAPELFMKTPNAIRVGGGLVSPAEGDFSTDSIELKVRHVFGGTMMDYRMAVASNGSGA